jgi:hypothetical protein
MGDRKWDIIEGFCCLLIFILLVIMGGQWMKTLGYSSKKPSTDQVSVEKGNVPAKETECSEGGP